MWIVRLEVVNHLVATDMKPKKIGITGQGQVHKFTWKRWYFPSERIIYLKSELFPEIEFDSEPIWKRVIREDWIDKNYTGEDVDS